MMFKKSDYWRNCYLVNTLLSVCLSVCLSVSLLSVLQEAELDDSSLIGLSVPGDVAKKLLHYLKQKLPSSCLSDLLCSHTFCKHYLRRGGGSLEDEELLGEDRLISTASLTHTCLFLTLVCLPAESSLGSSGLTGGGGGGGGGGAGGGQSSSSSSASASSSSAMASVSKKAKKELPADSGCCSLETESELPSEDDSKYPDDLEDKMKGRRRVS